MAFKAIRKSSTPQIVASQILQRIDSGELAAGQRLPSQRELADQLSVGRSSIREAINALMVMGYLEVRQGSGTYVRKDFGAVDTSIKQFAAAFEAVGLLDLMEAREILECRSAALAADRADTDQLQKLKRQLIKVEATQGDYRIFLQADIQFHTLLASAAGNPVIEEITKLVLDKLVRQHKQLQTKKLPSEYREKSIQSARHIVAAIEAGNGSDAAHWMKIHLETIRSEIKEII